MVNSDATFLLQDSEGVNIGVITKQGKGSPKEFNDAIETAIKEQFVADEVVLMRAEDELTMSAKTVEDGEDYLREFTLLEITLY